MSNNKHSKSYHTYSFYYNRRNDPKWRNDYLKLHREKIRTSIIEIIILFVIGLFAINFVINQQNKKPNVNNQPATSSNITTSNSNSK